MLEKTQKKEKIRIIAKYILNHHSSRKVLSNSGWLFLDKIIRLAAGIFVSAGVARYLGPNQFGEISYALAFIALFQSVTVLGLDGIAVREISQDKQKSNKILGTIFWLRTTSGILCWITSIISIVIINGLNDPSVIIVAIAGGTLLLQSSDTVDLWFQSQSQSRRTFTAKIPSFFLSNALKVIFILLKAPLLAFAATILIESLISAVGMIYAYKRYKCDLSWQFSKNLAIALLHESWPFIISSISIMIYMRIDQIMIKELIGSAQLGVFAAVLPLATIWQTLPVTLNTSLAPFVAKKKSEDEKAYWNILENIFKIYALLGWIICIFTLFLGPLTISLLFGKEYQEGIQVLIIYVFTNVFINMGMAQSLWMLNERRPIISLVNTLSGAIVCVIGNFITIPHYGISGVAMIAVISQFTSAVLTNLFFSRKIFFIQFRSILWPFPKLSYLSYD